MAMVLSAEFYARDPGSVAEELIGCVLHRRTREGLTSGRIVETEAYLAEDDPACHAAGGKNRKNAAMFCRAGTAYVYTIHAVQCFNIVTEQPDHPSAVLIRAVEPLSGIHLMEQRRGTDQEHQLCRGPGRLCQAFAIGRDLNFVSVETGRRLWVTSGDDSSKQPVLKTTRIGVTSGKDLMLRFCQSGSSFVSGPRWLNRASEDVFSG